MQLQAQTAWPPVRRLLADDDHAATGVAGRVQAERVIPGLFGSIAGLGDDPVAFGATGLVSFGEALVPR